MTKTRPFSFLHPVNLKYFNSLGGQEGRCELKMGEGQNYENQNVENQKELRKPCKPSQRRKELLKRSERRKANYHNVEKS